MTLPVPRPYRQPPWLDEWYGSLLVKTTRPTHTSRRDPTTTQQSSFRLACSTNKLSFLLYVHGDSLAAPQSFTDLTSPVLAQMTSFNSTDLAEKYPNGAKVRAEYLPIHPSPPHPDTREILHLRDGMTLRKKSYLKISVQHTVRFDTLRPYDRTRPADYFLEATSYQKLVRLSGFDAVAAQAQAYLAAPQIAPQHRRMGLASVQPLTEPLTPVRPLTARQPAEILEARYYGTVPKPTLPDPVPSRSRPGPRAGPGGMTYLEIFHYCAPTLAKLLILGLMGTGVYAAWVGRAQLGQLMVQLLKCCAAHAAWLVKTMLKGLWYGMGWLLKSLWGIVRGVAGGLWRWLRTRSGKGEVVVRWWTR